ncbi:DUF397 domain-containing protein [Cryptosporangium sp. NPDC051539]|uniref:DUF397 domain-containing protein n=1 Tax=Cryptosporangium sp. NPDC051539 TaxID=3363962 RepID=UPI00379DB1A5
MPLSRRAQPEWRKSSYSGGSGNCVEVARTSVIHVRDTKQQGGGPELTFSAQAWADFVGGLRTNSLR